MKTKKKPKLDEDSIKIIDAAHPDLQSSWTPEEILEVIKKAEFKT